MARIFTQRVCKEIFFVCVLIIISRLTEALTPLVYRKIHPEELWLYKNPRTPSFISSFNNWVICTVVPLGVFWVVFLIQKNVQDLIAAILGTAFSAGFAGTVTNIMKNVACRPRPDFYERCFPDGRYIEGIPDSCTGDHEVIIEGLKSFPSGHSSLAFSVLGFVTLYLAGKLQCFNTKGRQPWRLVVSALPAFGACIIALSRTADYHHHWQDVLVGSCLGILVAYVSYRQHYPPLSRSTCHLPYIGTTPLSAQLEDARVISPQFHTPHDTESNLKTM